MLRIRVRGVIHRSDFSVLASATALSSIQAAVFIYIDWAEVEHWTFSVRDDDEASWRRAANGIERVAIVHDHLLNRQAAWLSAVLRGEGVCVRCWRSRLAVEAEKWLCQPAPASEAAQADWSLFRFNR